MNRIPKDRLFVQVPYEDLLSKLWLIGIFRINCEIYIKPELIDSCLDADLNRIRKAFDKNKNSKTCHAPIYDPYKDGFGIFKESYFKSAKFCRRLQIDKMVMHVEYDSKKSPSLDGWLKENIPIWKDIASSASYDGMSVFLENHNESSPRPITQILNDINSPNLSACIDIGHFNAFGRKDIISYLDDYPKNSIREIHLSDNLGDGDTHLPLGKGNIDFSTVLDGVDNRNIDAIYTIEAKDAWGVMEGMNYLRKIGRL